MGLPVAIGETKIGISAWVSDLYDGVDAHMDADALNADENTVTIGKTPGTDYALSLIHIFELGDSWFSPK